MLQGRALRSRVRLAPDARPLVARALTTWALSARAYDRVLRVARTIADLEGSEATRRPGTSRKPSVRGQ